MIGNGIFVFHKFSLPSTFFLPPLPYRHSGVPVRIPVNWETDLTNWQPGDVLLPTIARRSRQVDL